MKEPMQPPSKYAALRPLSEPTLGLVEEEFAHDPFQLLVVCIFLNRTRGERAIPQARLFLQRYPRPELLSRAIDEDIQPYFKTLGLWRRAAWLINLAKGWEAQPPQAGVVYTKRWDDKVVLQSEVAHLKGVGKYASDAWRIFCKDELYRRAGYVILEPEWKRVRPDDKELRRYVEWKHQREAFMLRDWNCIEPKEPNDKVEDILSVGVRDLRIGSPPSSSKSSFSHSASSLMKTETTGRDSTPLTKAIQPLDAKGTATAAPAHCRLVLRKMKLPR